MLQIPIALAGILIGTVTDLKRREVPDWVNYSLIGSGLGISLMFSAFMWSVWPIAFSVAGLLAGYLIGALMYYSGQWGGGDAKMIMGLGALLGLPFLPSWWSETPFFVYFLVLSLFAGAGYGLAWMTVLFVRHRTKVLANLTKRLHTKHMVRLRIAIIIVLAIAIVAAAFLLPRPLMLMSVFLCALVYITFYFSLAVKAVEETCFVQKRSLDKLVEGDWMIEDVLKGKKVLLKAPPTGLSLEDIALLKKHGVTEVTIKEGIPFVPSFLIAFLCAWYLWHNGIPLFFWW